MACFLNELQQLFASASLPLVAAEHTRLLRKLGKRLLLDNQRQRILLKAVLRDASFVARGELVETSSIKNFVEYLFGEVEHVALDASLNA